MPEMPIDIAVPAPTYTIEERGDVLRVTGMDGGPLDLRVDEGLVFAKYLGQEPRQWAEVTLPSVVGFFAANSPVATFMRRQGAFPLRQLLLDALSGVGESDHAA
ncbi:MAG: hypothetical protein ACK54K_13275 [Gemmatimonadaceae bacterium]